MPALRATTIGTAALLVLLAATASAQDAAGDWKVYKGKVPEVTTRVTIEPATAGPGDVVTYKVRVQVAPPWHIYEWSDVVPKEGPRPTQFKLVETGSLQAADRWTPDRPPTIEKEPAFPNLEFVSFHENEVTWTTPLVVPENATPGDVIIKGLMRFQICFKQGDQGACKPRTVIALPDVTLRVERGASAVVAAVAKAAVPQTILTTNNPGTPAIASPSQPATDQLPHGEVGDAIRKGLLPFLLIAALHGLLAVLMPCVWPMIPITVNFFVKQSQAGGGKATRLALVYSLAIISMYTLIGLLITGVFRASPTKIGNNPWLNLIFGLAFIAFGLSLLGLFEIRLPSSWLNASAKAESRGGLIGVFFMAVTLTITSFTCTFPLVGSLLTLASRGQFFYPVVGLLTFSTVLSLPFLVLALAPSMMQSLPRGGDWMNAVKVVGGLLEIGAAFKFLNTSEVSFHGGQATAVFFDSQVVLAIWVVILVVCGIYLLGLFRTDHDHDAIQVGPMRLIIGVTMLSFALYLAPALFGNPPRGELYRQIAGIFPPDANERLDAGKLLADEIRRDLGTRLAGVGPSELGAKGGDLPQKATSNDPKVAIREEREALSGMSWGMSFDAALEEAKAQKKPVLIDFTGVSCANCRNMETGVMPDPQVVEEMRKFVRVRLYTDFVPIDSITKNERDVLGEDNRVFETELVGQDTSPFYVIVDPGGKVLITQAYDLNVANFVKFLKTGQDRFKAGTGVASN